MFSKKLEDLILHSLQDGYITDQERNAIIKRAAAEGEDIDEVSIYISSLLQKRQEEINAKAQEAETTRIIAEKKEREAKIKVQREEQKEIDRIQRKCPVCGTLIPILVNVCPECGHTMESQGATTEIVKLMEDLKKRSKKLRINYEGELDDDEYISFKDKLQMLYGNNSQVNEFLFEMKYVEAKIFAAKLDEFIITMQCFDKKNSEEYGNELDSKYDHVMSTVRDNYGDIDFIRNKIQECDKLKVYYDSKIDEVTKIVNANESKKNQRTILIRILVMIICLLPLLVLVFIGMLPTVALVGELFVAYIVAVIWHHSYWGSDMYNPLVILEYFTTI